MVLEEPQLTAFQGQVRCCGYTYEKQICRLEACLADYGVRPFLTLDKVCQGPVKTAISSSHKHVG